MTYYVWVGLVAFAAYWFGYFVRYTTGGSATKPVAEHPSLRYDHMDKDMMCGNCGTRNEHHDEYTDRCVVNNAKTHFKAVTSSTWADICIGEPWELFEQPGAESTPPLMVGPTKPKRKTPAEPEPTQRSGKRSRP